MHRSFFFVGAFFLLSATVDWAEGPSFDCAKATTKVEKMICSNIELSKLDGKLAKVYNEALGEAPDTSALKHQQREWLKVRNTCSNADCVEMSYRSRIGELQGEPAVGHFLPILSKEPSLCEEYKRYVEHEVATREQNVHNTVPMCRRPFGKDFPAFKSVQWREISPADYPELAVQAYRYMEFWPWDREGAAAYLAKSEFASQLSAIKLNYSNNWWHMWLGEADIGNNGRTETLLRVERGRCGEPSMTGRPPRWQIPVMVVDKTGKDIDTEKSERLIKVAVPYPVTNLLWPPALYWSPNIRAIPGSHSLTLTAFDVFTVSEKFYFDQWNDEWNLPLSAKFDPRYATLAIFQVFDGETETVCRYKFRKQTN